MSESLRREKRLRAAAEREVYHIPLTKKPNQLLNDVAMLHAQPLCSSPGPPAEKMHIKQVIIQGLLSYKEQTVIEPFSPGHNVVGASLCC